VSTQVGTVVFQMGQSGVMQEPDWNALAGLDDAARQVEVLRLASAAMAGKTDLDEEVAAAELPEPLRVMWVLNWLDFEVTQGSLLAFFYNSHGRFAAEAAAGLDPMPFR
jgi:hypothetical protein